LKKSEFIKKCKKIKLILTDVDGVLTDGCMYYSSSGEELKKFHTRDGMAVELLLQKNIKTIIITREKSKIVISRAKKINVFKVYSGIKQKDKILNQICTKFKVTPNEIVFIGDDINDEKIMKLIGLSFAPSDATQTTKNIADIITNARGGQGVLREVTDEILLSQSIISK
jgi:YrbI family 3-deoxy-D-manno-octulosonate 8-phosphate phosphatase|tara:strand:+ start:139 stop:648 length:510 start_codon:yes stop_codon:yes gene_type:complete